MGVTSLGELAVSSEICVMTHIMRMPQREIGLDGLTARYPLASGWCLVAGLQLRNRLVASSGGVGVGYGRTEAVARSEVIASGVPVPIRSHGGHTTEGDQQ